MPAPDASNSFYAKDRAAWRCWLQQNADKQMAVWLILYRKESGKPTLGYNDAVEEALCFGWIDSKPNKRDDESYFLFFAQRKPKSNWSKSNKERVERLSKRGLITPRGQALIDEAKRSGTWDALNDVDALKLPVELKRALAANNTAKKHFEAFPPSVKKGILEWIGNAKTEVTKSKRISETVRMAAQNERVNQYIPKPR